MSQCRHIYRNNTLNHRQGEQCTQQSTWNNYCNQHARLYPQNRPLCTFVYQRSNRNNRAGAQCNRNSLPGRTLCSLHRNRRTVQFIQLPERISTHGGALRNHSESHVIRIEQHYCGEMIECSLCQAKHFIVERKTGSTVNNPIFIKCCKEGRLITLPKWPQMNQIIANLLRENTEKGKNFRTYIRLFNSIFGFGSMRANFDRRLATTLQGTYTFRISGAVHHLVGDIQDQGIEEATFGEIYIYDPRDQIERRSTMFPNLNLEVLETIQRIMLQNPLANAYYQVNRMRYLERLPELTLRIIPDATDDRARIPETHEIAVLLPGDGSNFAGSREILVRHRVNPVLQTIHELHQHFDTMVYPLMFPTAFPGYDLNYQDIQGRRITVKDYYSFHLHIRQETSDYFRFGRLLHQYIVDQYAKIEAMRLRYIRNNQQALHHIEDGTIKLPSSFTGGPRYMSECRQDAMAIVRKFGKPDLFITMTCNPNWPEITENLLQGQTPNDRPDLINRVFRIKYLALLEEIKHKKVKKLN